jgi:hypothetical protein
MIITAITLFALSGLMVGFTVGAFTHPRATQQTQKNTKAPALTVSKRPIATKAPTITIATVKIGCPIIPSNEYGQTQISDGTTEYTFSAQIVDKSIDNTSPCGKGNPLAMPDLSCKMWLVREQDDARKLADRINSMPNDQKEAIWNFQTPFPKEVTQAVQMDNGGSTAINCNPTGGPTTWHYKLSPDLDPGAYFITVLANSHGNYSNWAWVPLTVTKN